MSFTITKHEEIYAGRVFTITRDEVRHESGYDSVREVVHHNGGAVIAAVFSDGDLLLVRQFRYPMQTAIVELPAGKLDAGEDPQDCAIRELEEETGWICSSIEKLTSMMTTPGFCNEVLHIYLATGLTQGTQRLEQGEESMEILRVPLLEAVRMCATGAIADGKSIAGIMLAAMKVGVVNAALQSDNRTGGLY